LTQIFSSVLVAPKKQNPPASSWRWVESLDLKLFQLIKSPAPEDTQPEHVQHGQQPLFGAFLSMTSPYKRELSFGNSTPKALGEA
jgi:hypothetical protein